MPVLPRNADDQIMFCESHLPVWAAAPAAVGLTAEQCTSLTEATGTARSSLAAAQAAREASKAATTAFHADVAAMRDQAADLIRQIKAYAELQTSPSAVYAAAQISPAASPTPAAAPGKPTDVSIALNSDGSVTLSWSASDSSASTGAFFAVSRKLPGQTAFTGIGGAPGSTSETRRPTFTDSTVPASAASQGAQYIVQGFRGTRAGEASDAVVVQFGTDGGGGFANATLKMAA